MPIDYVNHGAQEVIVITSGEARGVIPLLDQLVVEQDTGKLQVGNGSTSIADLPYVPSPGGGGDSLPTLSGSGSPFGSIGAARGALYRDTDNGSLYLNFADDPLTADLWVAVVAVEQDGLAGFMFSSDGQRTEMFGGNSGFILGDVFSRSGNGNGIYFNSTGTDGGQSISVQLGAAGEFATNLNADGTTELPGDVKVAAGAGYVVTDSTDGHTYRLGTTNGATVWTQVT